MPQKRWWQALQAQQGGSARSVAFTEYRCSIITPHGKEVNLTMLSTNVFGCWRTQFVSKVSSVSLQPNAAAKASICNNQASFLSCILIFIRRITEVGYFLFITWEATYLCVVGCEEVMAMLDECHAQGFLHKLFGGCNAVKRDVNKCLRAERLERTAQNREKAKAKREKIQRIWNEIDEES